MREITLMPGETVVDVERVEAILPDQLPDHRRLINLMTAGGERPPVAALGTGDDEALARFVVVFGRDALFISDLTGDAALIDQTLVYLAARQGLARDRAPEPQHYDARHEEEGRIFHEERDPETDEIARRLTLEEGWQWPIYTADDATPLFVKQLSLRAADREDLLGVSVVQRDDVIRTMKDAWRSGLNWILRRLDPQDGLLYSKRAKFTRPTGEEFTGFYPIWQDSVDSAVRKDGTLAMNPVAFVEVQGLVFDALMSAAALVERYGFEEFDAEALRRAARKLRRSLVKYALVNDSQGAFFAFGIEKRDDMREPLAVRKSNTGHLLDSGIFDDETHRHHVEAIVTSLFDPSCGLAVPHGIRTLSALEASYRPGGYHTGTVWVWEQAMMARGLARHGFAALAAWQENAIVGTCEAVRHYPEYVRGDHTPQPTENSAVVRVTSCDPEYGTWTNTITQPGQVFQGWTVAAYDGVLERVLGYRNAGFPAPLNDIEVALLDALAFETIDLTDSAEAEVA